MKQQIVALHRNFRVILMALLAVLSLLYLSIPTKAAAGSNNANFNGRWTVTDGTATAILVISGENLTTGAFGGQFIVHDATQSNIEPVTNGQVSGNVFTATIEYPNTVIGVNGIVFTFSGTISGNTLTMRNSSVKAWHNGKLFSSTVSHALYTGTRSGDNTLSVSDVVPGTDALSADVKVTLKSASTNESDCDQKATYDFTDANLDSAKEIAPCKYRLTFDSPGTGIYHVGLKATLSSGTVVPVSVDQYGEKVDGRFTLIIDSCSKPDDDVPDVDSLLDADNSLCDVAVGDWDSDAADVATKVIAAIESSPTLAAEPVPVDEVDPTDWPGSRGLRVTPKSASTGWIPIGTKYAPVVGPAGKNSDITGNAVALASEVYLPPLPHVWAGAEPCDIDNINLDDRPPDTVFSMHGWWYTANGLMQVPEGDQISTYVPMGSTMLPCLSLDIDTGHVHGADTKYLHVYTAGQLMPNFTFLYFDGAHGKHVVDKDEVNTLISLVRPNEGKISISACSEHFLPAGVTLTQALSLVPVHEAQTGQVVGYSRVSITKDGEVQSTSASP
jgi:hypothetical protein